MTLLMAEILGVWVLALLAGVPLFATMGLAAFAFVAFGGLSMSIVPQKLAQSVNSFPLLARALGGSTHFTLRRCSSGGIFSSGLSLRQRWSSFDVS